MSVYRKVFNYEPNGEDAQIGVLQNSPDGVFVRLNGDKQGEVFETEAAALNDVRNVRGWPNAYLG